MRPFIHKFFGRRLRIIPRPEPKPPAPKPAPAPDFGVLTGVGAFTYGSPEVVLPYLDLLDWVAVLPGVNTNTVASISLACRVVQWQPDPSTVKTPDVLEPPYCGLVLQAESQAQLDAGLQVTANVLIAWIGNPTSVNAIPAGVWLNECYENANPASTILGLAYEAGKRGGACSLPCFGMYHEGDEGAPGYVAKKPLADYLTELQAAIKLGLPASWSFWTAEQLDPADWQALQAWRASNPKK